MMMGAWARNERYPNASTIALSGGDSFPLQKQDPDSYNTAISWRQPVIDWIMAQSSSAFAALEGKIDAEPRGTSSR